MDDGAFDPVAALPQTAVFRVEVPNIAVAWADFGSLFEAQLALHGTHTLDDVNRMLLRQAAQLWVQWSERDRRIEAAVVTEFLIFPQLTALNVWLTAARRDAQLHDPLFASPIVEFARRNGCARLVTTGRAGWLRRFPKARFLGVMMSLEVE